MSLSDALRSGPLRQMPIGAPARPFAIFDLDGTLIDSRATIWQAMQDAFAAMSLPPPDFEAVRRTIGLGLQEVMRVLAPDVAPPEQARLVHFYREAFVLNRASGRGSEPLYPGARALVESLSGAGWYLGIATGKARRGVEHFFDLHGMRPLFHAAYCAEDGPGKPDPFMVHANLRALDAHPRAAVLVGDATHDMRMAKAAGVHALGVTWGFGLESEIRDAGADVMVSDFSGLQGALDQFAVAVST